MRPTQSDFMTWDGQIYILNPASHAAFRKRNETGGSADAVELASTGRLRWRWVCTCCYAGVFVVKGAKCR